ncbi:cAMP-specific 3',5'-cyclic phosphodiesterase, isoform F [Gryllus bimaculatus]|nr:cAMP-specific 3',5'-cyclic phosphodiesterase, isoform F [Gryllus bimaculatus]
MAEAKKGSKVAARTNIDINKPARYPAPVTQKSRLIDTYDFTKLTADKAARRVLAPYVRTVRRPGSIVAAYVAQTKEDTLVNDIHTDSRFPEGVGWLGPAVKSVLCIPVLSPDDECLAGDVQIIKTVTGWMGAAIHQNQQRIILQKQQELNDYLLELTKLYFCDVVVTDKIISDIVTFAKATLQAERGCFFIIDQECDELVADWYDEAIEDNVPIHKKKFKIMFSKDRGIAGLVARKGEPVNIKDAYSDSRFHKEVDTRVVQLVNKKTGPCFTSEDEKIFKIFLVYCALAIQYANLQTKIKQIEYQNEIKTDMLTFHMRPHPIERERVQIYPADNLPPDFNTELIDELQSELQNWKDFVLIVKKSYRNNPYHNFEHAFNVLHCMYNLLKRNLDIFTPLEIRGLTIAALCHDLDHPGYTNNFLQLTNHALSLLYTESTLENHHFQVAMLIINTCDIFSNLSKQTFKELTQEIHDAIIATDLAYYFRVRGRIVKIMGEKQFDWTEGSHRCLLKSIMMTTCDLSGQCKPFCIAKVIVGRLYREFYHQGDTERNMGLSPLSLMDREKQQMIPEDQVQFITFVCLPCIQLMVELLPNTISIRNLCEELRASWKEIIELRGKDVWRQEDSHP